MNLPRGAHALRGFSFGKIPMKNILFLQDFAGHKAGEHVMADDQVACDAIACGAAVPSVDAVPAPAPAPITPQTEAK